MSNQIVETKKAKLSGIQRVKDASAFPGTIKGVLDRTASGFSEKGIQIRDRSGRRFERWNYCELLECVSLYCGRWRSAGIVKGDRVLICQNTSWDFICAWLGAICIGAIPAAIAPTVGGGKISNYFADRLEIFRSVIGASTLLVSERIANNLRRERTDSLGKITITLEELIKGPVGDKSMIDVSPEDLAFLQFTSGSTGTPRAVMISHRMATHNAFSINEGISKGMKPTVDDWGCLHSSWLPMHHDMGLIGCLLFAISCGIELSLMNPATFLSRPLRYLETVHGRRALLSGPNFGYQFCVDRFTRKDVSGLDLSGVGAAMTGSEMIRPETMQDFCDLVSETGFRPERVLPCYGMAEATLAVAFDQKGKGIRTRAVPKTSTMILENQEVVCVGEPLPDMEVIVADSHGRTLNEDELGEIQVRGPSVFTGYFQDKDSSCESLRSDWLKTGDLGFIYDGELYVAGRTKEILVIRGENIMPHEIEWLAEEARGESKSADRVAAFSVSNENAGEEIALVVETHLTDPIELKRLDHAIRSRIGRGISLPVADLVFVRRGKIPRTSSGKIQRGIIKQQYLEKKIERLAR